MKKRKIRKVEKKNNLKKKFEKKNEKKGKSKKEKEKGEESLWIIVVIHNEMCVGEQWFPHTV